MPESSNSDDSPASTYRSRMSSLGLEATPSKGTPKSGKHIFVGVVVAAFTYLVLAYLLMAMIGGVIGSALLLVALVVAVMVGVRVYRLLQRQVVQVDSDESIE